MINYRQQIAGMGSDPAGLEETYQEALQTSAAGSFSEAIQSIYGEQPDNLLYAAWHYRLAGAGAAIVRHVPWLFALLLALTNGLLLWLLSDIDNFTIRIQGNNTMPYLVLMWSPLVGLFILAYLARTGAFSWRRWSIAGGVLILTAIYSSIAYPIIDSTVLQEQYLLLAALHLPVVTTAVVGASLLGGMGSNGDRFAFLLKSLELMILGGLFLSALGVLVAVTFSLFQALGIELPVMVQRLLVVGGAGVIPVLAVAITYDAGKSPAEQSFEGSLSRLLSLLLRLFLPLTFAVLAVYLCFVPFFFWRPFENRDVLITYNAMLFAVLALLLGVTPSRVVGISPTQQRWLWRGIVAVAALTVVVSVYALSAILYRTLQEGLTLNRVTFIGWNLINTGLLVYLLAKQTAGRREKWLPDVHQTFAAGALCYALWSMLVIFVLPWLF